MKLFSKRYGYIKVEDVIIREKITLEIQNAICSVYDKLQKSLPYTGLYEETAYIGLERYLWTYFLNQREGKFSDERTYHIVATHYIENEKNTWYSKLDIIEETLNYLNTKYPREAINFAQQLNFEFERLNFAYRIINNTEIVDIVSKIELTTIEEAINSSSNNIKLHLSKALELFAQRPTGDYRNSIKESISAVEALTRHITGDNVLNFKKMEDKGIILPSVLRQAFEKLYGYSNDKTTGIRHALMDDSNPPQAEEALFMLVSCSAFINYINKKNSIVSY